PDDEISLAAGVERDRAAETIIERDRFASGSPKAPRVWCRAKMPGIGTAAMGACPWIRRPLLARVRGARGSFHVRSATSTRVDQLLVAKVRKRFFVECQPCALQTHLAVPIEAQPAKVIEGLLCCTRLHARRVDVLDAQGDLAAGRSRNQPGNQEGAGVADV